MAAGNRLIFLAWKFYTRRRHEFKPVAKRPELYFNPQVKLKAHGYELLLGNPWKIASTSGSEVHNTVIVELASRDGGTGIGEAAPASLYGESAAGVLDFLARLDTAGLSFNDVAGSMAFLEPCRTFRWPPNARSTSRSWTVPPNSRASRSAIFLASAFAKISRHLVQHRH